MPEGGILGVGEPVGCISLQSRQLPEQRREVAGYVPGHVLRAWGPTYAFLGLVAEASIHASYGHPTVLTDLIIASPAAMPRDGTHLSKSLERIVHRIVR
jgi:hypothetical protein